MKGLLPIFFYLMRCILEKAAAVELSPYMFPLPTAEDIGLSLMGPAPPSSPELLPGTDRETQGVCVMSLMLFF